jgi:hypothetical protein
MAVAGSITYTEETHGSVRLVKADWLSDAAGDVTENATTEHYSGVILYAAFVPDAGGTQPTDQYDVTVLDKNSLDVLNGLGANKSNSVTAYADQYDGLGAVANSKLTVTVDNAGNAKGGIVYLWIR